MKRWIILTLAFALSMAVYHSPANAQKPQRFTADTGIVSLGSDQVMRIIVNAGEGDDTITVQFRQIGYQPATEEQGIMRLSATSRSASAPITLNPGEGASLELTAGTYGRGIVSSNSQKARVTVHIVNKFTNRVESVLIALLLP